MCAVQINKQILVAVYLLADSGTITLDGAIGGRANNEFNGGTFVTDVSAMSDEQFSNLNNTLNQAGFTYERSHRVRSGNINFAETDAITAEKLKLIADTGAINISGDIFAASDEGSLVNIYANNDVNINSTALIDARTLSENEFVQGQITIATTEGEINLLDNSDIRLQRVGLDDNGLESDIGPGGVLYLRAPRVNNNEIAINEVSSSH